MRLPHLGLAILVCFAWGLNAVAAKIGVTYIPPVFFTALRYIAVFVCIVPWLKPVPGKWDVLIPAVFFMGGLHFALIFSGREILRCLDDVDRQPDLRADLGSARR